jgi:hypothetical protein
MGLRIEAHEFKLRIKCDNMLILERYSEPGLSCKKLCLKQSKTKHFLFLALQPQTRHFLSQGLNFYICKREGRQKKLNNFWLDFIHSNIPRWACLPASRQALYFWFNLIFSLLLLRLEVSNGLSRFQVQSLPFPLFYSSSFWMAGWCLLKRSPRLLKRCGAGSL